MRLAVSILLLYPSGLSVLMAYLTWFVSPSIRFSFKAANLTSAGIPLSFCCFKPSFKTFDCFFVICYCLQTYHFFFHCITVCYGFMFRDLAVKSALLRREKVFLIRQQAARLVTCASEHLYRLGLLTISWKQGHTENGAL